jgi:calcineurin-like phosphoesterase family protein
MPRIVIDHVTDRDVMRRYATAVREQLETGALDSPTTARAAQAIAPGDQSDPADPARQIAASIPADGIGEASSHAEEDPFVGRDPIVSLLQTSVEAKLHEEGLVSDEQPDAGGHGFLSRLWHKVEGFLHPQRYGPDDPEWVTEVGKAMLERLALGNHPFNPVPAEHEIADDARIVIVGDWGSGLARAKEVARFMAEEVQEALAQGRQVHVVHLGDVYYSGDPKEYDRHVLDDGWWPVTPEQANRGVTSWALNGNHDMYSGGWGYFDHLLADARFARQRGDGRSTSFFRLKSPSWSIVGLDTSWDPNVLTQGHTGVLRDPQTEVVTRWAGEEDAGKVVLLSHHQFVTVYDPRKIGADLKAKLQPLFDSGRITAWLWGHEHRCMGFETPEVQFLRCIGNGGVPVLSRQSEALQAPAVWEVSGHYEADGHRWGRFGFAILDLAGDHIDVRYRDDKGAETRRETFA